MRFRGHSLMHNRVPIFPVPAIQSRPSPWAGGPACSLLRAQAGPGRVPQINRHPPYCSWAWPRQWDIRAPESSGQAATCPRGTHTELSLLPGISAPGPPSLPTGHRRPGTVTLAPRALLQAQSGVLCPRPRLSDQPAPPQGPRSSCSESGKEQWSLALVTGLTVFQVT